MANLNELLTAFSYRKQAAIGTANVIASYLRIGNWNRAIWPQNPVNEDDAAEIGKSHEFAEQIFKSHMADPPYVFRRPVSSELLVFGLGFGCGKVVESGSTPNMIYTITPLNGTTDGIELPYFSYAQQMRPGGSAVIDQTKVGCAVKSWKLMLTNSPGRAAAMFEVEMVNSGKYVEPSTLTLPAVTSCHELPASSLTLTINSIEYVTSKNFVSLEAGYDNNPRPGFFPGSGSQDSYQIQGRIEKGDATMYLRYVARFNYGSTELTKLRALTTGTAVAVLTYDSNNMATLTWQKVAFQVVELGEADGVVTVAVTCSCLYHASNGLFSAVVKVAFAGGGFVQAEP